MTERYIPETAEPEDAEAINALFIEMLNTIYSVSNAQGYEPGYLDRFFSGGEDRIFTVRQDTETVAFLSVQVYRAENYVYLDDFSVTESFRDRGIGSALLAAAEKYAREKGIRWVCLHAEKSNGGARRFYLRHGYTEQKDEGTRVLMMKTTE